MFIRMLFSDPRSFAALTLIVVFSICLHEFMHAYVALKMGDPTAAEQGHLTMNPFKQMGIISLIMLLLIGLAWGQVPVNPGNLKTRSRRIAVALAGVSANLALAVIFIILAYLTIKFTVNNPFALTMLIQGAVMNLVLLCINIMPIPGLDGFNVLREFIRFDSQKALERANICFFILTMLLFVSIDRITGFALRVTAAFLNVLLQLGE